jgi:hypothetical protein
MKYLQISGCRKEQIFEMTGKSYHKGGINARRPKIPQWILSFLGS